MQSQNSLPQLRNTKPRSAGKSLDHIPEEIIEEILSRLPVKSLLRLKCASKSWRSVIGSERFIKFHLQNSTENTAVAHHKVILKNCGGLKQCSLSSLLNDPIPDMSSFDDPMIGHLPETGCVVGCCNGLVCIFKNPESILLWNPSTRISKILPNMENDRMHMQCGFGWDEQSGAHKVFVVWSSRRGTLCKVYSTKTDAWKTVEHMDFHQIHREGKFVGGKLHWCTTPVMENDVVNIVTFDLKSEVFGVMEKPFDVQDWSSRHRVSLGVLNGCLSLLSVYQKRVDVWVMKESWAKVIAVPHHCGPDDVDFPFVAPLCIGLNGEIFLVFGSQFLVYHPKENVLLPHRRIIFSADSHSHVCIESSASTQIKIKISDFADIGQLMIKIASSDSHLYVESLVSI